MDDIITKLKPIAQLYKAEAAVIGFTMASAAGAFLGWGDGTTAVVAVIFGYALAYLRTKG